MVKINYKTDTPKQQEVPLNYRGISLISTMCQLFTNTINKRLIKHLDNNVILEDEKNGFKKDISCKDHIYSLTSIIISAKTWDKVLLPVSLIWLKLLTGSIDILFVKLANIGVSGYRLEFIKSLYADCKAAVNVNAATQTSVLQQGSVYVS